MSMRCMGVQMGACGGAVAISGPSVQWDVLGLHHGAGPLAPHGGQLAMALRLLCLWLRRGFLVPGLGEECLQLPCCG